ncbi:Serpentine Receptor, class H [Caenorhabditis elegans]|uniref:Serpentine Receptor, class H n=1 Tax=Caenorhabditis elegans TaxID=6239 RepID=Q9TXQ3_CAEEL|nr:Serpentine Receptor, class H [Caenorhabditis elegans]CCD73631.1 Serpentine Receptor, class H [Caenorhabditis elegans]|eukprot:NP_493749.2 Serpentine Receptor, class H [Caenorhabditis elegans]
MPTPLEEYYATNYSKCNITYTYLASWQGIAYPSHIAQVFSLPFQILAFYLIIFQTPVKMKQMQWSLFLNHLFCAFTDLFLCTLSTPYIFGPIMAIAGVGVLSWLGIPFVYQGVFGGFIVTGFVGSYVRLFECRSSSIQGNRFRISRRSTRLLYYTFLLIPYYAAFIVIVLVGESSNSAKLKTLSHYPCPTREFFILPVFILLVNGGSESLYILMTAVMALIATVNILIHVICLVYYLYVVPPRTLSKETRQNQRVFLVAVVLQTSVPLMLIIVPGMAVVLPLLAGYYRQEWINLAVNVMAFHGLGESIAIVLVHKPYRHVVRERLRKRTIRNRVIGRSIESN